MRDWRDGTAPADPAYAICYVNAFQTQPGEHAEWPKGLVLRSLGDDPEWEGEYLVDIATRAKRRRAARFVAPMIATCARKGFEAVEYDNLDSWTRFDGTPRARRVPFGKADALAYARLLARSAHAHGLAVGQKNTPGVTAAQARRTGFEFAIAEECGRYVECDRYRRVYGDRMIAIEYRRRDFRRTCRAIGAEVSVMLRDRLVSTPASPRYVYDAC